MSENVVLALLALVNFTHICDFMVLMPLGPQLIRQFALDPHQFSILVSVYALGAGVMSFAGAFFLDRFERKRALLLLYVAFLVGTALCGFASSYPLLFGARLATGLFGGCLSALLLAFVGDVVPVERRGRGVGVVMMAFSLASVAGVPLGLWLATKSGDWHTPFQVLALVGALVWAALWKFLPEVQREQHAGPRKAAHLSLLEGLSQPGAKSALLVMPCLILGHFTLIPFLSPYLVFNLGFAESSLPAVYFFGGLITFFSSPMVGRLCDRIGSARVLAVSAPLGVLPAFLLTNFLGNPAPAWAILSLTTAFFLTGQARFVPAMALVTKSILPRHRGALMSLNSCGQQMASGLASFSAGLIVLRGTDGSLQRYDWLVYWSFAMALVAVWLGARVAKRVGTAAEGTKTSVAA